MEDLTIAPNADSSFIEILRGDIAFDEQILVRLGANLCEDPQVEDFDDKKSEDKDAGDIASEEENAMDTREVYSQTLLRFPATTISQSPCSRSLVQFTHTGTIDPLPSMYV